MNKGTDSILSVYSDARAEYTKQLCAFLVPAYFQFYIDLLEKAKQTMISEPKKALWQFQNYLNDIHDWNNEKVNNEIHILLVNSGCDYLEDLLTAVFIAHTKVLTAIRLSSAHKKIDIKIPKVEHFLFKALCETAKLLWGSTYLFRDGISGMEKQQNYRTVEGLLNEGVVQAVRSLVPVKTILKDFMYTGGDSADVMEEESDEEKEQESELESTSAAHSTPSVPSVPSPPIDVPVSLSEQVVEEPPSLSSVDATPLPTAALSSPIVLPPTPLPTPLLAPTSVLPWILFPKPSAWIKNPRFNLDNLMQYLIWTNPLIPRWFIAIRTRTSLMTSPSPK